MVITRNFMFCLLLVYRDTDNFIALILYLETLTILFISVIICRFFRFSICIVTSLVDSDSFIPSFRFYSFFFLTYCSGSDRSYTRLQAGCSAFWSCPDHPQWRRDILPEGNLMQFVALLPYSEENTNNMLECKALKVPADMAPAGPLAPFRDVQ